MNADPTNHKGVELYLIREALHGTRPYGLVENIIVDEDSRSKGIGQKLAHKFFEREGYNGTEILAEASKSIYKDILMEEVEEVDDFI